MKRIIENNKKIDISGKLLMLLAIFLILGGSAIFLYPNVSNYFAEKNQVEAIIKYNSVLEKTDEAQIAEEMEKARIYNENLSGDPVHDPFIEGSGYALPDNYKSVLDISNDGVMAYIEIPKISVYLPIYHGTSDDVLEKGVGHIQNTSVPIGGISTHAVLTGHTGLPKAELFTKLDELIIGDIFYIHVLNELITYKVYETKVILPDNIDELQIQKGYDYITLVTCTPYGVNSHRLLIKAERTEYEEYQVKNKEISKGNIEEKIKSKNYYLIGTQIGVIVITIIVIVLAIIFIIIKKRKSKH